MGKNKRKPKKTNSGHAYISKLDDGRYLLHIPGWLGLKQQKMSSTNLAELMVTRNQMFGEDFGEDMPDPEIIWQVPAKSKTPEDLWQAAFTVQDEIENDAVPAWTDVRIDSSKPVGLALMSDLHIGSPYVDYKSLYAHSEIVRDTPGLFLLVAGDERDNFIISKLAHARRSARISVPQELIMYKSWVDMVREKIVSYVTGNHDLWTYKLSGVDLAEQYLPPQVLYDKFEVRMRFLVGQEEWKMRIRHRWAGRSYLNLTNGIERDWQFMPFDIGIGGDYHDATLCREFIREDKIRFAILLGTYKRLGDPFFSQVGKQQSPHNGAAMIIMHPNGDMQWFRDLEMGAEYLTYLRGGR